jgi:hypothetical protein
VKHHPCSEEPFCILVPDKNFHLLTSVFQGTLQNGEMFANWRAEICLIFVLIFVAVVLKKLQELLKSGESLVRLEQRL